MLSAVTVTVHAVRFTAFDEEHWSSSSVYSAFYDKSTALEFKAYLDGDDASVDATEPAAIFYSVETFNVRDRRTPACAGAGFAGMRLRNRPNHEEYRIIGIYDTKDAAMADGMTDAMAMDSRD